MMKKKAGIWIDTKQAVIVFLNEEGHSVKTIQSLIDSRERVDGQGKEYTRMGSQFMDGGKTKEARRQQEIKDYLKEVTHEIGDAGELVLFGPAEMKKELAKYLKEDATNADKIKAVETTDSMTENQMVAWVKQYYI